jgi:hypothetical protein
MRLTCECGAELNTRLMDCEDMYPCLVCGRLYDTTETPVKMYSPPTVAGDPKERAHKTQLAMMEVRAIKSKQLAAQKMTEQLEFRLKHECCEARINAGERRKDVYIEVFGGEERNPLDPKRRFKPR